MSTASVSQAQESGLLNFLNYHQEELVKVLVDADLKKLSEKLLKCRVLTKEQEKLFASLDHDQLDADLKVRYLLCLVNKRIATDSKICSTLITELCKVENGAIVATGRTLNRKLNQWEGRVKDSRLSEDNIAEKDISILSEILADYSNKWEEISISLNLSRGVRKKCGDAYSNQLKLHNVLTEWIVGFHKYSKEPTLSCLQETLASNLVNLFTLSTKLNQKFKDQQLKQFSSGSEEISLPEPYCLEITYESSDIEVDEGKSMLFEVQTYCGAPVSFQWIKDGEALCEGSVYSGTQTDILHINQGSLGREGEYKCIVTCETKQQISSPMTLTVAYAPDKKRLLALYSARKEIPNDSWPLVNSNVFIELALKNIDKSQNKDPKEFTRDDIEDIINSREKVKYEDIFSQYDEESLIIVEGRPGSGKTTLAHKLTKDWIKGIMLKNVDKLYLISLRYSQRTSDIFEPFCSPSEVKVLENLNGKRLCFILDGFDEYSTKNEAESKIHQLINKTYLPLAMVIVTSRPVATAKLFGKVNKTKTIAILGFTKAKFEEYVNNYPISDESRAKLLKDMDVYSNTLSMCYLPINAAMLCYLYRQNVSCKLPETETQFYEYFVKAIFLRKLRMDNDRAKLKSLKDLNKIHKDHFKKICLLAFEMTKKGTQVVHELPISLDILKQSPVRSLLTIDYILQCLGLEDVIIFVHLTLQEFLAAYHLASLTDEEQLEVIQSCCEEGHMMTMFKFYCGLAEFKEKQQKFCAILKPNLQQDCLHAVHCAFETQQEFASKVAVQLYDNKIFINATLTPADFTALGYVISVASKIIEQVLILDCIQYVSSIEEKEVHNDDNAPHPAIKILRALKKYRYQSVKLHTSYKIQPQYHVEFERSADKYLTGLLQLYPDICEANHAQKFLHDFGGPVSKEDIFSSEHAKPLTDALLKCRKLKRFMLTNNLSQEGAKQIGACLKKWKHLEEIEIHGDVDSSNAEYLAAGIRRCYHFKEIKLYGCDLSCSATQTLAQGIKFCENLETLVLSYNNLNSKCAELLAEHLPSSLKYLDLSYNSIGCEGTAALANSGCFTHLEKLGLSNNGIASKGGIALAHGLSESVNFHNLEFEHNNIDSHAVLALAQHLQPNQNFQYLNLSYNNIDSGNAGMSNGLNSHFGMTAILKNLCHWTKLHNLALSGNNMGFPEIYTLTKGLRSTCSLTQLYLSHNNIDFRSAIILAFGLHQFCPILMTFVISHNNCGSDGVAYLGDALKAKPLLASVNFSSNNVRSDSMEYMYDLIKHGCRRLDLSHNYIDSNGAEYLVNQLIKSECEVDVNISSNNISPCTLQQLVGLTALTQISLLTYTDI